MTDTDKRLQLSSEGYRRKHKFRRRGGEVRLWAPGQASQRKQRLSWESKDKDGLNVELGRKCHSRWGEIGWAGQPRRRREQVTSGDTAQTSWQEPRDVEGSKGNQAVWKGYGHTVKP